MYVCLIVDSKIQSRAMAEWFSILHRKAKIVLHIVLESDKKKLVAGHFAEFPQYERAVGHGFSNNE